MSAQLLSGSAGRLALLAIALGLVLMHHVVGAHQHSTHQHSTPDSAPPAPAVPSVVELDAAPPTGHHEVDGTPSAHGGGAHEHAVAHGTHAGLTATSTAALLHHHPGEDGHDHAGSLLHTCLVALVGATAFLLVLVLAVSWWPAAARRSGTGDVASATVPRAPPTSSRLAELQILRL